jgi:hypothetical protein
MNKTAIKNYAVKARRKLIESVGRKMTMLGVAADRILDWEDAKKVLEDRGVFLTDWQKTARDSIVEGSRRVGWQNYVEEVAYTWFNRLIALRFMEINGYLPSNVRVLSSKDAERIEPDCVREYEQLDFIDRAKATDLRNKGDEAFYRYILTEQCNALGRIMPKMFSHISGACELLLPDRLYVKDGIVYDLTHEISEDDWLEAVEIIGWLYQYYISEKKDEVFASLKKNVKITRENIPAATQLFTPDWIVKYMVENSLGRLWLESHPDSNLRKGWKYYLDEAEQTPEVAERLRVSRAESAVKSPEDIKVIDPCMGSGHILAYAFDVLFQIYQSAGYAENSIPDLILQKNLYGLDIDERACQLAYFALMMKARSKNRRFFRRDDVSEPQVYAPAGFPDGQEYGSLVKVDSLEPKPECPAGQLDLFAHSYSEKLNAWNFRRLLAQKYDVVVTNPPYMGSSGMGAKLSEFVKKEYPDSKSDLSTAFMEQTLDMCKPTGLMSMINIPVWMFLSSYEKLRKGITRNNTFVNMLHFGRGIFGSDFGTTSFVIAKNHVQDYFASYRRLFKKQGAVDGVEQKEKWFFEGVGMFTASADNFAKIPGSPVAYWVSEKMLRAFEVGELLEHIATPKKGLATTDNDRFLRLWHEVSINKFNVKWFPLNKGGEFRRWYGNKNYLVNWYDNGAEMKAAIVKRYNGGSYTKEIRSEDKYFLNAITWSALTAGASSFRYSDYMALFDSAGSSMFPKQNMEYVLGLLNTKITNDILSVINPTLNYGAGSVSNMPVIFDESQLENVKQLVSANIALSRADWDAFETSWDFKRHPLV